LKAGKPGCLEAEKLQCFQLSDLPLLSSYEL
jgi:hypothetical protein